MSCIGSLVTFLTYANFFTAVYGWIGLFCLICVVLMLTRSGKNWADWDVILFRLSVGATATSIFVNRMFNQTSVINEPAPNIYIYTMVLFHVVLAYASAATTIRVWKTISNEARNYHQNQEDYQSQNFTFSGTATSDDRKD